MSDGQGGVGTGLVVIDVGNALIITCAEHEKAGSGMLSSNGAMPYRGCIMNEHSPGLSAVVDSNGVNRSGV